MGGTCSVTGDVKGKANEFFKAGKYCEAVEAYTFALDADPKDHTVYSNRSAARMKYVRARREGERRPGMGQGRAERGDDAC